MSAQTGLLLPLPIRTCFFMGETLILMLGRETRQFPRLPWPWQETLMPPDVFLNFAKTLFRKTGFSYTNTDPISHWDPLGTPGLETAKPSFLYRRTKPLLLFMLSESITSFQRTLSLSSLYTTPLSRKRPSLWFLIWMRLGDY